MKNTILGFLALTIALLLGACGTSTNDDPSHFGTWRIDTQTHATWQGTPNAPVASVPMAVASENDTTAKPDTTYFYSNDKIQAKLLISRHNKYVGDIQLNVNQNNFNGLSIAGNYSKVKVVNLDDSFKRAGGRGSLFTPTKMNMKIQLDFDCNAPRKDENLKLAFIEYQVDSVSTPPDTLLYYSLSTKGMYTTAAYLKGCN